MEDFINRKCGITYGGLLTLWRSNTAYIDGSNTVVEDGLKIDLGSELSRVLLSGILKRRVNKRRSTFLRRKFLKMKSLGI
jgi:hypothetical protein